MSAAAEPVVAPVSVPVLDIRGLSGGYGKLRAVRDLTLSRPSGSVLALLGPNGAGKTTLLMTLAGLLPRQEGEVAVDGAPIPSGNPIRAGRAGVVLVPDSRSLFTSLTVRENIELASHRRDREGFDRVIDMFPSLKPRLDVKVGAISGGEQQMVAMGRGIIQRPRVFLIDELSMGLAPKVVESLLPVVRGLADTAGTAVVLVEQHVNLALEIADDAVVLNNGSVTLEGSGAELRAAPERLTAAYLGEAVAR